MPCLETRASNAVINSMNSSLYLAMTNERKEQLLDLWIDETNEEWTQEWREELTPEEAALVKKWDEKAEHSMAVMAQRILSGDKDG